MVDVATLPIRRTTLHDELVGRLRHMIIEGDLQPGAKLSEKDLCAQFGVSRTPLREALKVLAKEGLVRLVPNRGATVSELTLADLEEAFPIMGALEALAGELACTNITEAEIAELEALQEEMVAKFRAGELKSYFSLNEQIHQRVLDAARNPTLSELQRGLSGRVRRARYMANMSTARWAKAVAEHEAILAALRARDGARMADLMKAHIANKLDSVRAAMIEARQPLTEKAAGDAS